MAAEMDEVVHRAVRPLAQNERSRYRTRRRAMGATLLVVAGAAACSPGGVTDNGKLPPGVQDPNAYHTPSGAADLYRGTVLLLPRAFEKQMTMSGIVTDELMALPLRAGIGGPFTDVDARVSLVNAGADVYPGWHRIRAQAREARGFLTAYAPDSLYSWSPAFRQHLYAVEGYADIFLADLFCSGIPLSTLDFNGDYTLAPGSTTKQVYAAAVALFDSAIALGSDSARLQSLAAVGRGRALLALGQYAEAATAVAAVSTDFKYQMNVQWEWGGPWTLFNFANGDVYHPYYATVAGYPTVGDREGTNGLDYRSSGDPRTQAVPLGPDAAGYTYYYPEKYPHVDGPATLTLADGIEARLIEAEAALQAGDITTWLTKLNELRTDGTGETTPGDTIVDTLGVTGCGGVCGTEPGGSDPSYGQPAGGFPGYTAVDSFTIDPVSDAIRDYCWTYSWYEPCYVDVNAPQNGRTTVYTYIKPATTAWNAGTGGVAGLGPLADPGTPRGRVDLLFRERAFWLYLTGHRQGDLRRLIREYGRVASEVYPAGEYPGGPGVYGSEVVVPVPESERELNPQFTGCLGNGA